MQPWQLLVQLVLGVQQLLQVPALLLALLQGQLPPRAWLQQVQLQGLQLA